MAMVDSALHYASLGMAVFPVEHGGKKPLTVHGVKEASTDKNQIRQWWRKWPYANIGIATGAASGGIYVIDFDVDDDRGLDGWHEFEEWGRENNFKIPDTPMVITGRGGYHMYFKTTQKVGCRTGVLDGIDVRGDGGYVVAPPSVHSNGNEYRWEYDETDCPFAEADEILDKLLQTPESYDQPNKGFQLPDVIPKGQRNNILFQMACSLQSKGLDDDVILSATKSENESRCETPLPESEIETLVASALRYKKGDLGLGEIADDSSEGEDEMPRLVFGKDNNPLQITQNVVEVLEHDKNLHGSICYNELAYSPFVRGELPWDSSGVTREWSNFDDSNLFNYVEFNYKLKSRSKILEALDIVMNRHRINPVKEMLEALRGKWDGKADHIENLLPDYMGVEKNLYSMECMRLFMLGAITRIYHPGAKFDYMLVLVGKQGIGKSTFFKYLAMDDKWFDDNFNTIDAPQAAEKLRGMWMVEMAELLATKRAKEIESIKSFLTSTADNYRQPYNRRAEKRPRMCVFAGTTNSEYFLTDRTGNRRFLPLVAREDYIKKSLFDEPEAVAEDFAQAWGEAMNLYERAGGKPRLILSPDAARAARNQQQKFTEEDPRVGIIQNWLDSLDDDRVCATMIWKEALGFLSTPTRRDSNDILTLMGTEIEGWERMDKKAKCGKYGPTICYERMRRGKVDKKVDKNFLLDDFDDLEFGKLDENDENPFD